MLIFFRKETSYDIFIEVEPGYPILSSGKHYSAGADDVLFNDKILISSQMT